MPQSEHSLHDKLEQLISLYRLSDLKQKPLPFIAIDFNLTGCRILGKAKLDTLRNEAFISVNQEAYEQNPSLYQEQIFTHEFAHIITHLTYKRRTKPHGNEFKLVCKTLFPEHWQEITRASTKSGFALKPKRTYKRYRYRCGCGEALLTSIRHNRVLKGINTYRCRKCGETLRFTPTEF